MPCHAYLWLNELASSSLPRATNSTLSYTSSLIKEMQNTSAIFLTVLLPWRARIMISFNGGSQPHWLRATRVNGQVCECKGKGAFSCPGHLVVHYSRCGCEPRFHEITTLACLRNKTARETDKAFLISLRECMC